MTVIVKKIKNSFAVIGAPVSQQASAKSKQRYREMVAEAASSTVDTINSNQRVKIEIDWFSEGSQNKPDIDNIIKPIQDALKSIIYVDDNQVESIIARKHDTLNAIRFTTEPLCVAEPLMNGCKEYIFIRIY